LSQADGAAMAQLPMDKCGARPYLLLKRFNERIQFWQLFLAME
jgi:hypothetical protein